MMNKINSTDSTRKKVTPIVLSILAILLIILVLIQVDTNNLMKQVEVSFLSMDYYVDEVWYNDINYHEYYINPDTNYIIYNFGEEQYNVNRWFNRSRYSQGDDPTNIEIKLKLNRNIAIHNFFDGYIWFSYAVEYFDKQGNHLSGGATSEAYPVKMKIHKENGEWQVVHIWERP